MLVALLFHVTIFVFGVSAEQFSCRQDLVPEKLITISLNHFVSTSKHNNDEYLIKNISAIDHFDDFAENNRTYILIHGYTRSRNDTWIGYVKTPLLNAGNANIIILDWKVTPNLYNVWAHKTTIIAEFVVDFLNKVADHINKPLTEWSHLHVIGHSMGGQMAGQVGKKLQDAGVRVARVTGLDPAEPCFKNGALAKLSAENAEFVDVIHTDSDPNGGHFGVYSRAGHIDFYPHDGSKQPDCQSRQSRAIFDVFKDVIGVAAQWIVGEPSRDLAYNIVFNRYELMCNHYKAPEYLILSLLYGDTCKLWAIPESEKNKLNANEDINKLCQKLDTCAEIGINADRYTHLSGKYYTNIKSVIKHCHKKIKINLLRNSES